MSTKKGDFLQKFYEALANGDTDYIVENVTEDVHWTLVGNKSIHGKSAFIKAMETESTKEIEITNIITHGISAAIDGTIKVVDNSGEVKTYAFCDIYRFNKFKDGKIKEITSYFIEKEKHIR